MFSALNPPKRRLIAFGLLTLCLDTRNLRYTEETLRIFVKMQKRP